MQGQGQGQGPDRHVGLAWEKGYVRRRDGKDGHEITGTVQYGIALTVESFLSTVRIGLNLFPSGSTYGTATYLYCTVQYSTVLDQSSWEGRGRGT